MGAERARVVVIGGGVVGCSILWELTRRGIPGLLLEAEADICEGTSKANSGIVHTGFDARPGTLEAQLLRAAQPIWPRVVEALAVPFLSVGAIMLARDDEEAGRLKSEVAPNAARMGVAVELLDRAGVRSLATYVAPGVVAALSIPGESVIDPFWLTRAYAEAAIAGGAEVRLNQLVVGLELAPGRVELQLAHGQVIVADQVVDAAGLRADEIARLAGDTSFSINPRKGQFLVSEETFGVDRIVLPIPGPTGKGMLITPIVFGGLLLGPTAVDGSDKEDRAMDAATRERILAACQAMVPDLVEAVPLRQFVGLRHVSSSGDFIVRPSAVSDRLYLVAGIRSTGISTSPAIAASVVTDVAARRGWELDVRPRPLSPMAASFGDSAGEIVCLCRSIGRGEIEASARRPISPTTLDGIKRRGGALFGDCQGNLCAVDVATILADERGVPVSSIEQNRAGTWLWRRRMDRPDHPPDRPMVRAAPPAGSWDVVVVGGGLAGRAAADVLGASCRSLTLERMVASGPPDSSAGVDGPGMGWTAVGLVAETDSWIVLAQSSNGTIELRASAIIVATGGYVTPAEQRGLTGPRVTGLMTSDRAWRCLAAGLLPGAKIALVGQGVEADRLGHALTVAGARVDRLAEAPVEVRGRARLEAVRTRTGWLDADTLVLADTRLSQTFLLRGLGLVDGVPGRPAPTDPDGRLPLPGLWAAGCCVAPDPGHAACAASGAAVGRQVAASLRSSAGAPSTAYRP